MPSIEPAASDDAGVPIGVVSEADLMAKAEYQDQPRAAVPIRWAAAPARLGEGPSPHCRRVDEPAPTGVTLAGTVEQRSQAELAVRLTHALPGVVAVADQLNYRFDDINAKLGTSNLLH